MKGVLTEFPGLRQRLAGCLLRRRLLAGLVGLLLAAAVLMPLPARAAEGLQEVAPPAAVQQLRQELAAHQPRLTILAPQDGALLPPGPWSLRLRVDDWPLVDAGAAGLGPHLVVQLDEEPPRRLTSDSLTMPELVPGSHRLTVYAARPWGEAVKNPGAFRQIRLHRAVTNPPALPAQGSPQLIPVMPSGLAAGEPLLLDWLMLDTPLQGLRQDSPGWRLRVSVNGDSFLVDRQSPLWLKGWRRGENAIRLELLDGRGEPLNPPYNSLVRTVDLQPGGDRPAWLAAQISPNQRDLLLGRQVAAPETPASAAAVPEPTAASEAGTEPRRPPANQPAEQPAPPGASAPRPQDPAPTTPPSAPAAAQAMGQAPLPAPAPAPAQGLEPAAPNGTEPLPSSPTAAALIDAPPAPTTPSSPTAPPASAAPETRTPAPAASREPAPPTASDSERLKPGTALEGTARQLVNADGTLRQPPADGPLARLRQQLGR